MAAILTTITIIGDISPAFTDASPSTRAPKTEREVPLPSGVLESPSYRSSNVSIKINASIIRGKGDVILCFEKLIIKDLGSISGS